MGLGWRRGRSLVEDDLHLFSFTIAELFKCLSTSPMGRLKMKLSRSLSMGLIAVSGFIFIAEAFAQQNMDSCMSGYSNQRAGFYDLAIGDLENCIKTGNLTNGNLARAYRFLGQAYNAKAEYSKAIHAYDQALSLHPKDPWFDFLNRGNVHSSTGELQKALTDYEEALKLNTNLGAAFFYRGIVYEKMGQLERSKSDIFLAYEKGFRSPQISARMYYYQLGKTQSNAITAIEVEKTNDK
jgi:tetratricopeptide (TPR) repeat protein